MTFLYMVEVEEGGETRERRKRWQGKPEILHDSPSLGVSSNYVWVWARQSPPHILSSPFNSKRHPCNTDLWRNKVNIWCLARYTRITHKWIVTEVLTKEQLKWNTSAKLNFSPSSSQHGRFLHHRYITLTLFTPLPRQLKDGQRRTNLKYLWATEAWDRYMRDSLKNLWPRWDSNLHQPSLLTLEAESVNDCHPLNDCKSPLNNLQFSVHSAKFSITLRRLHQ